MFRRTSFLIDPKVQFKVIFLLAFVALVGTAAICATVYNYHDKVALVLEGGAVSPQVLASEFRQMSTALMLRLGFIVLSMTAAFVAIGFVITHRIAGPLYKLRVELQKLLRGEDIGNIRFRKDDEFQDIPDLVNRLIEKYKGS